MTGEHVSFYRWEPKTKDRAEGYVCYPGLALTEPNVDGAIQLTFLHPERLHHLGGSDWQDAMERATDVAAEGKEEKFKPFFRTLKSADDAPSAADLDADAEEKEAKAATEKPTKGGVWGGKGKNGK